ncbi:peptide/nickel transport system permease protein [Rhizobiales bacterium GAS113]|nr:peptide/nickel transport system permease protein [Rhizobiales bacterium GAS113]
MAAAPARARGGTRGALARALRSWRTRTGLALMGIVMVVALAGPWFAPHGSSELLGLPFDGPQAEFPFGTDTLGRDVLSRFLSGGRSLVSMSLAATAFGIALGATLGLFAAYCKGNIDELIMRLVDIKLAFPSVVFALLIVTMFGPGRVLLVFLVGLSQAPSVARVIRGAALSVVEREYVQYAQAIGLSGGRIVFREILPNVTSALLVEVGLRLMWSISLLAGLSFLGFGIQPPAADWGLMINENRNALSVQPWAVIVPIAAIATFTIGGNIFAEGLARAIGRTDGVGA